MTALSERARETLLTVARAAIETGLAGEPIDPLAALPDPSLAESRGAFVTLHAGGRLRGCIGRVESEWPLWETVARMARAAAFDDPRFPALQAAELEDITLEVSVMTPVERAASPEDVEPGRHGVMVERGLQRGLFLPQVAREQGWDREMLLDQVCRKAGLPPDAWTRPDTSIFVFTAEIVEE